MDVGINSVVQALLNVDLGQFSSSLFQMGERKGGAVVDENIDDDSDDSVASLVRDCGPLCKKHSYSPNNFALDRIKECKSYLRLSGKSHFLRDDFVSSRNLKDYLQPSIWCWHPQRLLESNAAPLVC